MDPLSIAASVCALLEVGNKVSDSCCWYITKVRSAAKDIGRIVHEINLLEAVLSDLKGLVAKDLKENEKDDAKKSNLQKLAKKDGPLMASYDELVGLLNKLEPKTEGQLKLKQKIMWPFESKHVDKVMATLEKQRGIISLALLADNTQTIKSIGEGVVRIEESIGVQNARERRKKILTWLGKIDSSRKHSELRGFHEKGTNEWILQSAEFKKWLERPNQTLWVNGIPGAGKSVACSTLVERLVEVCKGNPDYRLAYYYFDFTDQATLTSEALFRSLLYQFSKSERDSVSSAVDELFDEYDDGSTMPDIETWAKTLQAAINDSNYHRFVVIDALDECPKGGCERMQLFNVFVRKIADMEFKNCNFIFTSRREVDIVEALCEIKDNYPDHFIELPLVIEKVDADIRFHVKHIINETSSKRSKWPAPVKKEIEEAIIQRSKGMFRLASCQLKMIENIRQIKRVRAALKSLPESLEETYDIMLRSVPEDDYPFLRKALMFIAFSLRPMEIKELADAIVIDLENETFDVQDRLFDPTQGVLEICSSFVITSNVTLSDTEGKPELMKMMLIGPRDIRTTFTLIKFAHASVKEYLVSERLASSGTLANFRLSECEGHRAMAEASLVQLLHFSRLEGDSTTPKYNARRVNLDLVFTTYAARFWHEHFRAAQRYGSASNARMKRLCLELFHHDAEASFLIWLNVYDPDFLLNRKVHNDVGGYGDFWIQKWRSTMDLFGSRIYHAAILGLSEVITHLLGRGEDPNHTGGNFGDPLQAAALAGHSAIVDTLARNGANINRKIPRGAYGYPLQAAAFGGHTEIVRRLLELGANVNLKGGIFHTALIAASSIGNVEIGRMLLDAGADLNCAVTSGPFNSFQRALFRGQGKAISFAAKSGNAEMIDLLRTRGTDIDYSDQSIESPLYVACSTGNYRMARVLLKGGANPDKVGGINGTPLKASCYVGDLNMVKMLLAAGADISIRAGAHGDALCASVGDVTTFEFLCWRFPELLHSRPHSLALKTLEEAIIRNTTVAHLLIDGGCVFDDEVFTLALDRKQHTIARALLDRGANPNAQSKHGTALQLAIISKDSDIVEFLLNHPDIDIDRRGGIAGTTALHTAVLGLGTVRRKGPQFKREVDDFHRRVVGQLLAHGADVNARSADGCVLSCAAKTGDVDLVSKLLEHGADVNNFGGCRGSPITAAAEGGNIEVVQILLDRQADVRSPSDLLRYYTLIDEYPKSATYHAAVSRGNLEIVEILHRHGADIGGAEDALGSLLFKAVNLYRYSGSANTAFERYLDRTEVLMYLVENCEEICPIDDRGYCMWLDMLVCCPTLFQKVLPILLSRGVDFRKLVKTDERILALAAWKGDVAIVKFLLDNGADPNKGADAKDDRDWFFRDCPSTPLCATIRTGSSTIEFNEEMFQLLLERGADLNRIDTIAGSPLHVAAKMGNRAMVERLINIGSDINLCTAGDGSPAHAALSNQRLDILQLLLGKGADINAVGGRYDTLLGTAARQGLENTVMQLLKAGADAAAANSSAVVFAIESDNARIVQLLLEAGADPRSQQGIPGKALTEAIISRNVEICELLLDYEADPNSYASAFLDQRGIISGASPPLEILELLVKRGAELQSIPQGKSFLNLLHQATKLSTRAHPRFHEVKFLVETVGIDINLQNPGLGTALMGALSHSVGFAEHIPHNVEMIKYLLNKGANPNLGGGPLGKPIHAACYHDAPISIVEMLLDRGAEINSKAGNYAYPLQAACAGYASLELIEYLLSHGAHVNAMGGMCWTAIQAATYKGNLRAVKLLLKYGARFKLSSETYGACDSIDVVGLSSSRWEAEVDPFRQSQIYHNQSQYHVLNFLTDYAAAREKGGNDIKLI